MHVSPVPKGFLMCFRPHYGAHLWVKDAIPPVNAMPALDSGRRTQVGRRILGTWGHRLGLAKGEFCRRMFRPLTRSKKQKLSMHSLPANVSRLQSTARK
jgi:hypothetical protein